MKTTYLKKLTKNILWLLAPFFFVATLSAQPVTGTTTFDGANSNIAPYSIFPRTGSVQGWWFFADGYDTGGAGSGAIYHSGATDPSYVSVFTQQYLSSLRIASGDGSEFDLDNIVIEWINFTGNFTMRSYRDGNTTGYVALNAANGYTNYDLSANASFHNIDEIRMYGFGNINMEVKIDEITISAPSLSIEEFDNTMKDLTIYPNPTSDYIVVKNVDKAVDYQIIDLQGSIITKGRINQSDSKINLKELTSGLFFLKIEDQQPIKILKI